MPFNDHQPVPVHVAPHPHNIVPPAEVLTPSHKDQLTPSVSLVQALPTLCQITYARSSWMDGMCMLLSPFLQIKAAF